MTRTTAANPETARIFAELKKVSRELAQLSLNKTETKALDKNGKKLKGAAKNSFLQKCEKEA